jgi:curli biogenesis system outer membrane secretion channel CsgG
LEIRIVDASTSGVLAVSPVQGQTSDVSNRIMTKSSGNWALVGGLAAYANTPMEKAIRICIIETVRYISKSIPAAYYKY